MLQIKDFEDVALILHRANLAGMSINLHCTSDRRHWYFTDHYYMSTSHRTRYTLDLIPTDIEFSKGYTHSKHLSTRLYKLWVFLDERDINLVVSIDDGSYAVHTDYRDPKRLNESSELWGNLEGPISQFIGAPT